MLYKVHTAGSLAAIGLAANSWELRGVGRRTRLRFAVGAARSSAWRVRSSSSRRATGAGREGRALPDNALNPSRSSRRRSRTIKPGFRSFGVHRDAAALTAPQGAPSRCTSSRKRMARVPGEGHYPWGPSARKSHHDPTPTSSRSSPGSTVRRLTVKYKDGEKKIIVSRRASRIVTYMPGDQE